jgi:outer membrane receptor protein involved in Fe transport
VGNPGLEPSRNTGFDGELRYTRRGIDAGLTAFVYRIDNYIRVVNQARAFMVPGVMNTMARSYANVDALTRGIEATASVPLASALYLSGDLSMVRGTIRGSSAYGADLPEIPPARVRVRLRYDTSRWNAAVEGVASARQDEVALDLRESPTAGFATLNLRGGVRLSRPRSTTCSTRYTPSISRISAIRSATACGCTSPGAPFQRTWRSNSEQRHGARRCDRPAPVVAGEVPVPRQYFRSFRASTTFLRLRYFLPIVG